MKTKHIQFISTLVIISFAIMSSISPSPALAKKKKIMIPAIIGGAILLNEALKNKKKKGYRAHKNKVKRKLRKNAKGLPEKRLSKKEVRLVQERLNILNYNVGNPDGILGRGTRNGIKQYQADIGEERTGYLTEYEFETLLSETSEVVQSETGENDEQVKIQIVDQKKQTRSLNYKPVNYTTRSINGAWIGEYNCGRHIHNKFEIVFKRNGNELFSVFTFQTLKRNRVTGTFTKKGWIQNSTGVFNLIEGDWINRPSNFYMFDLRGTYNEAKDSLRLTVTKGKCRFLTTRRTKSVNIFPEAWSVLNFNTQEFTELKSNGLVSSEAVQLSNTDKKIVGNWEGQLTCNRRSNQNSDLELNISYVGQGRYKASLIGYKTSPTRNNAFGAYYLGEKEEGSDRYFFAKDRQRNRNLNGFHTKTFYLSHKPNNSIHLALDDRYCNQAQLSPKPKTEPKPLIQLSYNAQGLFYESERDKTRCETLIKWANRTQQYPINRRQKNWTALYTDKVFIPVFGKPYTSFSNIEINNFDRANRNTLNFCRSDPIIRAKFHDARTALYEGFNRANSRSLHIKHVVKKNRILHHQILEMQKELQSSEPNETIFVKFEPLQKLLKRNKPLILNTEYSQINEKIDLMKSQIAKGLAYKNYDKIVAVEEPSERIKLIKQQIDSPPEHFKYLEVNDKKEINNRYASMSASISKKILEPYIAKIEGVSEDFSGVTEIQKLVGNTHQVLEILPSDQKKGFENLYQNRTKNIISKLVKASQEQWQNFPNTQQGIAESDKWLEKFDADFSPFKKFDSVKLVRKKYDAFRSKQILSSYNDFEHHLKNLNKSSPQISEEITNLLKRYLTTQSDYNRPVSLEYLFASEAFKANSPEKRDSKKISKNDQAGLNNKNKVLKVIDDGLDVLDVGLDDLEKDLDKLEQEVEELKKEK